MRTHRIRVAAAAAVTVAALSLTACQGSAGGTRDEGRASSTTTTAPATAAPTPTQAPTGTPAPDAPATPTGTDASGNKSTSPQGSPGATLTPAPGKNGGKGKGGSGKDITERPCDASAVRVVYSPVSRPLNHALLTVTNTGRTACNAYHAPVLRLDDGQAAVAVEQASKPQAVVTLFPGESAYAAMILSAADGSGNHGRTSKKLTVWFAPRDNVGSAGGPAVLKLPAGTYTDSTTRVTYWQNSMEDALGF
ncbi:MULTISPECIES: DUF4232 domain-containing protein [unclassified Streptomyces]|uniref:DUF4232 domain-containing protein n=1 Tax=unclassified Streptomyces TaxID=2593676 RepID=UPI003450CF96